MPRKKNSVPYRCPKCQAEGKPYGRLIFDGDEPGNCPNCKTVALVPSPLPIRLPFGADADWEPVEGGLKYRHPLTMTQVVRDGQAIREGDK